MSDPMLPPYKNYCKCADCGQYFTAETTFRRHRVGKHGDRRCLPPSDVLDKQGRRRLRLNKHGYWATIPANERETA